MFGICGLELRVFHTLGAVGVSCLQVTLRFTCSYRNVARFAGTGLLTRGLSGD